MAEQSRQVQTVTRDGEIVGELPEGYGGAPQSLAVSLARAEVDQQIATARAMPRSIQKAVQNIMTLATLDEQSAEECVYALPQGGKPVTGPSIRLAEIIASQWGNCRTGARVVHIDRVEKYVEAEGVFHDLETNAATTQRVRRRIMDKYGKIYSDDLIIKTGNAACSIAKRNAILGGVPKGVWRKAYDAVESVLAGDTKTLAERRSLAMKAFAAFGVTPEQVFRSLDVAGMDDITIEHILTLNGMRSALKSGEATVEEMFPRQAAISGDRPKNTGEALDRLASKGRGSDASSGRSRGRSTDETEGREQRSEPRDARKDKERTSKSQYDDDFPGDRPMKREDDRRDDRADEQGDSGGDERDQSPEDIAFDRGWRAAEEGMSRKAVPGEYRDEKRATEANSWLAGFDQAKDRLAEDRG